MNIEDHIKAIIRAIGEDPDRPGLRDTPSRVARSYTEMFRGYRPPDFKFSLQKEEYGGIVAKGNIPFFSTCEHHILPYSGHVDFGYAPRGYIVGISKIIRFIQWMSARLTIQERLTDEIADAFIQYVRPEGVIVIMTANHLCEACRGVRVADTTTITSSVRGVFLDYPDMKNEFFRMVRK